MTVTRAKRQERDRQAMAAAPLTKELHDLMRRMYRYSKHQPVIKSRSSSLSYQCNFLWTGMYWVGTGVYKQRITAIRDLRRCATKLLEAQVWSTSTYTRLIDRLEAIEVGLALISSPALKNICDR